jgi:hypothetical protein
MRRSLSLLVAVATLGLVCPFRFQGAQAQIAVDSAVSVVNLDQANFAVSWFTDVPVTGSILFGTSCAAATTPGQPESPSDGYIHLVSATTGTLASSTTYFFKVVSGSSVDDNGGACYQTTTEPVNETLGIPNSVQGTVTDPPACTSPASGVLVTVTFADSGDTTLPLAVTTAGDGSWLVVPANATDAFGNAVTLQTGDPINVTVAASSSDTASNTYSYDPTQSPQDVGSICLPNPIGSPSPTSTGSPTVTPTPASTGTVTVSPTTTGTPIPGGSHLTLSPSDTAPGAPLTVSGSGFQSTASSGVNAIVHLVVTLSDGSTSDLGQSPTVDANGDFSFQVTVPGNTVPGNYTVNAVQVLPSALLVADATLTVGTAGATATATSTPGASSTTIPTSTPIGQVATPTPSPTATVGPAPTASVRTTASATVRPTAKPEATLVPEKHHAAKPFHPKVFLAYDRIGVGGKESAVVHTRGGAEVLFIVYYPRHGATLTIDAHTDREGYWSRIFAVPRSQRGKATIKLVVLLGRQSRLFLLHFTIG